MKLKYRISPIDPIISRDARQFGAGSPMHTMSWLSNTLVAGAVRTAFRKNSENPDSLNMKDTAISGIFPLLEGKIYFPRPLDIIKSAKNIYQIKPCKMSAGCGTNMPLNGLLPALPKTEEDFKPEKLNAFWEKDLMLQWLINGENNFKLKDEYTLPAPQKDERIHACIDPETGVAADEKLFSTIGLDFTQGDRTSFLKWQISIDVKGCELPAKFTAPLGGERRLAEFEAAEDDETLWQYPEELPEFINGNLRLILASPAMFHKGWLPDWIDESSLRGELPNTSVTVELVSAVTDRWQPVSGWSYTKGSQGPKPMRRAVPAGSVYFFNIVEGTLDAKSVWLKSICTDKKNVDDGFGLVLPSQW